MNKFCLSEEISVESQQVAGVASVCDGTRGTYLINARRALLVSRVRRL